MRAEKDFTKEVDKLIPEVEALAKARTFVSISDVILTRRRRTLKPPSTDF